MGVYLHFQALPENSRLAHLLRTERSLCVMYCELIHRPAGPFDTARLPHEDFDEVMDDIARNPVFGSRAAAEQVYDDLQTELGRAAREYPGLTTRSAYFKVCSFDTQLRRGLTAIGQPDAGELVDTLFWGREAFAPDGFGGGDVSLRWVSPARVTSAAGVLREVSPAEFEYAEDDWAAFRTVYTAAAERGEGIVIA